MKTELTEKEINLLKQGLTRREKELSILLGEALDGWKKTFHHSRRWSKIWYIAILMSYILGIIVGLIII